MGGWLIALSVLTLLLLVRILQSPKLFYEFPYFTAFTFGAVLLPQAFSLALSEAVSDQQKSDLFCMWFLCLLSATVGYEVKPRRLPLPRFVVRRPSESQVFWGAFALVLIGSIFDVLASRLPEGTSYSTGIATIYLFFTGFMAIGFGISFYAALKYHHIKFWVLAALGSTSSIVAAIVYGRRENAALFLMLIASSFFFVRGRSLPRVLLALVMFLAMAIIPLAGDYRTAAAEDPLHAYKTLDLEAAFQGFKEGRLHPEMAAGLWLISDTKEMGNYAWGGGYWDELVFRYVPAQIVGMDFKKSLFIGERIRYEDDKQMYARGYAPGVTLTGAGDAFREFGFFGAVVFAILGYFFRGLWEAARNTDAIYIHATYANASITAMHCVTHGTADFLPGFLFVLIAIALVQFFTPTAVVHQP